MPRRRGVSLIETLVAIAIVGVLCALLLAGVQKVRDAASRLSCANQMKQLALAAHHYHDSRQRFPAGCEYRFQPYDNLARYDFGFSWQSALLPYLEQEQLGQLAESNYIRQPSGDTRQPFMSTPCRSLICPADGRGTVQFGESNLGVTHYIGVAGTAIGVDDGMLDCERRVSILHVLDGTSSTVMIGERPPGATGTGMGSWYSGTGYKLCPYGNILPVGVNNYVPFGANDCRMDSADPFRPGTISDCHTSHFWSLHSGGANFAFVDGSVRFLSYRANSILPALATRAGQEVVDIP